MRVLDPSDGNVGARAPTRLGRAWRDGAFRYLYGRQVLTRFDLYHVSRGRTRTSTCTRRPSPGGDDVSAHFLHIHGPIRLVKDEIENLTETSFPLGLHLRRLA